MLTKVSRMRVVTLVGFVRNRELCNSISGTNLKVERILSLQRAQWTKVKAEVG
jgi:hypothetical protein